MNEIPSSSDRQSAPRLLAAFLLASFVACDDSTPADEQPEESVGSTGGSPSGTQGTVDGDSPTSGTETSADGSTSAGTSSPADGSTSEGLDTSSDDVGVVECAEDEFVSMGACEACPAGTTAPPGADPSGPDTQCISEECRQGEFVRENACVPCPDGTINPPGDDASGSDTSCEAVMCGPNESVSDHTCVECPPGATNRAGDDASGPDTACDGPICAEDRFVVDGTCMTCPPGTDNEAGDDPAEGDTECDAVQCAMDEFVSNNACVACPAGSSNDSGDDASGPDTECDVPTCPEDTFVSSGTCMPCPAGTDNAAGDDPAGPDTMCDVIVCGEAERVLANACVPCPLNTVNEAGDLATGPDTECEDACIEVLNGTQCADIVGAYIKASNGESLDGFGVVGMSGDTLAVGATGEDSNAVGVGGDPSNNDAEDSGAVYVFVRTGSDWVEQAYIKAPFEAAGLAFGSRVDVSGDTLVVGSPSYQDDTGIAFVYERSGSSWAYVATISAFNADAGDRFGHSLAVHEDTIVVGAPYEESIADGVDGDDSDNSGFEEGAAYVFTRTGGTWIHEAYLKAPAGAPSVQDAFGQDVAVHGDQIYVGAPGSDQFGGNSGAIWRFDSGVDGVWVEGPALTIGGENVVFDGARVASQSVAFGGARTTRVHDVAGAGSTLLFSVSEPSVTGTLVGAQVVADLGDYVVSAAPTAWSGGSGIGAPSSPAIPWSGELFVYPAAGGPGLRIRAPYPEELGLFGGVASSGTTLAVGATGESSGSTGIDGVMNDDSSPGQGAVFIYAFPQ